MTPLFAANLFDNLWMVVLFFVVGAISNWWTKRQEKKTDQPPEGAAPSAPPQADEGFNLEETLRRLLDENSPAKPHTPPPIIPQAPAPPAPPAQADWYEESLPEREPNWVETRRAAQVESYETPVPPPPVFRPFTSVPTPPASSAPVLSEAQAALRFAQLNQRGGGPAIVVRGGRRRSPAGRRASQWRDPQNARRAFVASLVFGPPKGLELETGPSSAR